MGHFEGHQVQIFQRFWGSEGMQAWAEGMAGSTFREGEDLSLGGKEVAVICESSITSQVRPATAFEMRRRLVQAAHAHCWWARLWQCLIQASKAIGVPQSSCCFSAV